MVRQDRTTGRQIIVMVDSGATYNYIKTNLTIGESIPLPQIYRPKTLHGYSEVKSKKIINLLDYDLTFFEINELVDYDMILGEQGLRQIKATINFFEYKINYEKPIKSHMINYTNDRESYKQEIDDLMQKNEFISETLPYTTTIEAMIYDLVMEWQLPVKDGYSKVEIALRKIDRGMSNNKKLTTDQKARVISYARQAEDILEKLKKDGSWGVHGPKYSLKLVDEALVYVEQATNILEGKSK